MVRGSCYCGGVKFSIEPPTLFVAECACSACRRSHGSSCVKWAGVPTDRFRLLAGESWLRRYESSPGTFWSFCDLCGSSLFYTSVREPGETHVTVANLTDPLP